MLQGGQFTVLSVLDRQIVCIKHSKTHVGDIQITYAYRKRLDVLSGER